MTKYRVEVRWTEYRHIDVVARSEQNAREMIEDMDWRGFDKSPGDPGAEIDQIEEMV